MGRLIPVASRRVPVALWLLAFAGTAAWFPSPWDSRPLSRSALGDEAPTTALPRALSLPAGGPETTRFALGLETSWSSKDHRLRSLRDDASLEGELDVTVGLESAGLAPVTIRARSFEVKRRKRARFAGVFSDSEQDARGDARSRGTDDAPPPWAVLVSPRGLVSPEAAAVGSAPARWPLDDWLRAHDARSDEDARLRRLAHHTAFGTLLGVPPLPGGDAAPVSSGTYRAALPVVAGESGLTNKLVDLEAVYELSVVGDAPGFLRVAGPLVAVRLVRGLGPGDRTIDRWIDVAFARGGPTIAGELEARFDLARGRFVSSRSLVRLTSSGKLDGGSGTATFERRLSTELVGSR